MLVGYLTGVRAGRDHQCYYFAGISLIPTKTNKGGLEVTKFLRFYF